MSDNPYESPGAELSDLPPAPVTDNPYSRPPGCFFAAGAAILLSGFMAFVVLVVMIGLSIALSMRHVPTN